MRSLRLTVATITAAALAGVAATNVLAGDSLGQNISTCAHELLGQRPDPPTVTCTHDGVTMTFANFGAMVEHMRQMH
jgi:hypothetical protein